jgi:hypothetical protein
VLKRRHCRGQDGLCAQATALGTVELVCAVISGDDDEDTAATAAATTVADKCREDAPAARQGECNLVPTAAMQRLSKHGGDDARAHESMVATALRLLCVVVGSGGAASSRAARAVRVSGAFPSCTQRVLTEIFVCHARSC